MYCPGITRIIMMFRQTRPSRIYTLTNVCDIDLELNIDELFGYGSNASQGTGSAKTNFCLRDCTAQRYMANISQGDHDTEILITFRVNSINTAKVLTIPASAGAVIYTNDLPLSLDVFDGFTSKITGGGGLLKTTMRGFCLEMIQ